MICFESRNLEPIPYLKINRLEHEEINICAYEDGSVEYYFV